jgi:hypothetical protein
MSEMSEEPNHILIASKYYDFSKAPRVYTQKSSHTIVLKEVARVSVFPVGQGCTVEEAWEVRGPMEAQASLTTTGRTAAEAVDAYLAAMKTRDADGE